MTGAQSAFKALGPVKWDSIADGDLQTFLTDTFSDAQCLVDSLPVSLDSSAPTTGRPRSATDTDLPSLPNRAPKSTDRAQELRKEWKEVKVNARENPLGLNVYKLSAKDGKGAWFARRSVHEGLTFEKWKLGMEREFAESMKVQGKPGDGNIRGIGADKRVVNQTVEGCGKMQVYQLSAQFPGPTAPRDFVTLLLSSDSAMSNPMPDGLGKPRYFMVVSKPCEHPECPPRSGFIRGNYESVEFIREIKVNKPLRKVRSSIDVSREDVAASVRNSVESSSKDAMIRAARQAAASAPVGHDDSSRPRGKTIAYAGNGGEEEEEEEDRDTLIEWLMVTRSDPGGSVPRFMIERGTPGGIAGDANKFLKWISSKSLENFTESDEVDTKLKQEASKAEEVALDKELPIADPTTNLIQISSEQPQTVNIQYLGDEVPGPGGFYGMLSGALGVAASAVASRLPMPFGSTKGGDTSSDLSSDMSDASSTHSFHSFEAEENDDSSLSKTADGAQLTPSVTRDGAADSIHSVESAVAPSVNSGARSQHDKDLRKLEERKRKTEEKLQRAQERHRAKHGDDTKRDEVALQKLREKHDREVARQEERYQKELRKLEAKRTSEQKKAEERRRKQAEREDRANLNMELEKARAERDVARKQLEILKEQIGDLQTQNTKLVAKLGREGIPLDDVHGKSDAGGNPNVPPTPGLRRSVTEKG